jgi:hypothetical protein
VTTNHHHSNPQPQSDHVYNNIALLSPAQYAVYDAVTTSFNEKSCNVHHVAGVAGAGKSYLLQCIRSYFQQKRKLVHVAAPTGIAAHTVDGVTLHSLFMLNRSPETGE